MLILTTPAESEILYPNYHGCKLLKARCRYTSLSSWPGKPEQRDLQERTWSTLLSQPSLGRVVHPAGYRRRPAEDLQRAGDRRPPPCRLHPHQGRHGCQRGCFFYVFCSTNSTTQEESADPIVGLFLTKRHSSHQQTHGLPSPPALEPWRDTVEQRAVDMMLHVFQPSNRSEGSSNFKVPLQRKSCFLHYSAAFFSRLRTNI